jgi:hypothetical protein
VEQPARRLTEEQAHQQLLRILADVDDWTRRWGVGALTPVVERGGSLAGDDAWSTPYQVSHGVTHMLAVAAGHQPPGRR